MFYFFVFYLQDEIGLKEWLTSLKSAHKLSQELLGSMAKKAGKIYGTDSNNKNAIIAAHRNTNGNWNILTTTTITTLEK